MLVLLDAAALPLDVQTTIAEALAERRAEGLGAVPLDVQVAVVTAQPLEVFREQGTFHETLAERLGDALDAPILLPRLRERPEDLRSLVNERLAREGLRVKGTPMGMEDSAFAKLVEYDFPGELPELDHIVFRLVAQCDGHVVRARDIEALGLNLPAA
jgi:DNA-binding NtrC family response regulator